MLNDFYQSLGEKPLVAFSIGDYSVRWYGLAYLAGFVAAFFVLRAVTKRWKINIPLDDLLTVVLCAAFGMIFGAHLGYCLFYTNGYYLEHPLEILTTIGNGMSFHGGLVGILLGGLLASRITRTPFMTLVDLGAIAAPIGLFFGRCANFLNGELWGGPTSLPWGVVFSDTGGGLMARHPSQLYEALLEGVVIFAILFILSRKTPARSRGTFFGVFLTLYGIFRTLLEFVREPDAQLGHLLGTDWLSMGMCLSIPMIVAGIIIILVAHRIKAPQEGRREKRPPDEHEGEAPVS